MPRLTFNNKTLTNNGSSFTYIPTPTSEPYGIFNGTSSNISFDDFDIVDVEWTSMLEYTISFDYQYTSGGAIIQQGVEYGTSQSNGKMIFTVDSGEPRFVFGIDSSGYQSIYYSNATEYATLTDGEWHTLSIQMIDYDASNYQTIIKIDNTTLQDQLSGFKSGNQRVTTIAFGKDGSDYLKGNMKNILGISDGVTIIDCPDPSTGVNNGTGTNGTVTDITQG